MRHRSIGGRVGRPLRGRGAARSAGASARRAAAASALALPHRGLRPRAACAGGRGGPHPRHRVARPRARAGAWVPRAVDVCGAASPAGPLAAMQATRPRPLVVVAGPDPVAMGLVTRVAPPGGHVTGGAPQGDRAGPATRRPLCREAVPGVTRVAALQPGAFVSAVPARARRPPAAAAAARRLGIDRPRMAVDAPDAREGAVAAMTRAGAEALVRGDAPVGTTHRRWLLELAAPPRVPGLDAARGSVEAGGLMAAHVSPADRWRRAASDVARLLTGATPGDLPVAPPTTGVLGITRTTAEALGLPLPPPLRFPAAAGSRCAARPKAPRARDVGPMHPSTSVDTIRGPTPPGPGAPRPQGRVRLTCPGRHPREAPSCSHRGGRPRPTPGRPGLLHHHGCLGRPGEQRCLERCHPGAYKTPARMARLSGWGPSSRP
jgi:putative ABC transport system substrate-binding protein